jgi:hypothetical protein
VALLFHFILFYFQKEQYKIYIVSNFVYLYTLSALPSRNAACTATHCHTLSYRAARTATHCRTEAVCGSVKCGSVRHCGNVRQFTAVMCGSVWQGGSAAVCGSVRQCARQCVVLCVAMCVSLCSIITLG